jgi:hypothetical protein
MRIECKVCGIEKRAKDTNWKAISLLLPTMWGCFVCMDWCTPGNTDVFACGEQHALILFERWLATKNFEPGPQKTAAAS